MTKGKDNDLRQNENQDFDRLTGLYNRERGDFLLTQTLKICKADDAICCVTLLDINDLTSINEAVGHLVGDKVIQIIAQKLQDCKEDGEVISRFSGDEFLIISPYKMKVDIQMRMDRILRELDKEETIAGVHISFCYGAIEVEASSRLTSKKVIMQCDDAMYVWKRRHHLDKAQGKVMTYHENEEVKSYQFDESRLLSALMHSSEDYFYVCNMRDDPSTFRYSKALVDEFDLPGEIVQNASVIWGAKVHEADKAIFLESNQEIADGRVDFHNVEYRAKNKDGRWIWLRCRGHVERDEEGKAVLFAGIITVLGRKNKIDYLTEQFNKYEYEEITEDLIRKQQPFAAVFMDLDGFSYINKLYSHHFGDIVLAKTAQQIQSVLPEGVKLFRYDGDEFMMLFYQNIEKSFIIETFEKIQNLLEKQQSVDSKKYHISFSAGACFFPTDGVDTMTISKNTNYAVETSKRNGKNQITFFHKNMLNVEARKLDMIEQLRYSVEHNFEGFEMFFQPQVMAVNGTIMGAEALARWKCDLYGNVPPLVFIPLLEQTGMIHAVGRWIFEESVRLCKEFLEIMPDFIVSINLSYLQVMEKSFITFMANTIKKYELPAKQIIVEFTETRMMEHDEELKQIFKRIRSLGILIAMDDFGTGYSSLGVLKKSPADIVKIDKVFVKDVLISSFDATFIRFVVTLCHDVNIDVLLEGVETKEEYDKVREMELDFIQGYYFGKPVAYKELLATLQEMRHKALSV